MSGGNESSYILKQTYNQKLQVCLGMHHHQANNNQDSTKFDKKHR